MSFHLLPLVVPSFSFLLFSPSGHFPSFSLFPLYTSLLAPFLILWLFLHTLLLFLMIFLWFLLACILLSIYNLVLSYLNLRSISHIFFVFYPVFLPCPSTIPLLQTAPWSLPVLQTSSFSSCSPVWKFFLSRSMFSSLLLLLCFSCLVCVSHHWRFSIVCTLGTLSRSFFFQKLLSWSSPCSVPIRFPSKIFWISLAFSLAPLFYPLSAQYRLHMSMTIPFFLLPLCPRLVVSLILLKCLL